MSVSAPLARVVIEASPGRVRGEGSRLRRAALTVLPIVAVLLVWELTVRLGLIRALFLPAVSTVLGKFWEVLLSGQLLAHFRITVVKTDYVPKIQVRALAARQAFLRDNRDPVVRFLRVYLRAQQYAREVQRGAHTDEYLAFVRKLSDIPPEIALELIQETALTDELAVDDLMDTQRHFVMMKSQQRVIPQESVVDTTYLAEAKKAAR